MQNNIERQRDKILDGNIWKIILFISLPIALYNLAQNIFGLVDIYFMGYVGENELVAVTFVDTISKVVLSIGNGLSVAATTLIAVYIGKHNYIKAKKYLAQTIMLSIVLSTFIIILGFIFSIDILKVAGAKDDIILKDSLLYFRLNLATTPILLLEMTYVAYKRAAGDSKQIIRLLIVSMIFKLVVTYFLVIMFQMGIYGLFLGTLSSKLLFVIVSIYDYFIYDSPLKLQFKDFTYKNSYSVKLLILGLPLMVENSTLQLGHITVNSNVMIFGKSFFAAYGIANKINSLGLGFLVGLSEGIVPIIAQNLAAKNRIRVKKVIQVGSVVALLISVPIFLAFRFYPEAFVQLFIIENKATLNEAIRGLSIISIGLVPWGQYFIASSVFKAFGKTKYNLLVSFIRLYAFRIGLVYLLVHYLKIGKIGIWYSVGLSNVLGAVVIWIILINSIDIFKNKKNTHEYDILLND